MPVDEELWEWCGEIRYEIQTCSFSKLLAQVNYLRPQIKSC